MLFDTEKNEFVDEYDYFDIENLHIQYVPIMLHEDCKELIRDVSVKYFVNIKFKAVFYFTITLNIFFYS